MKQPYLDTAKAAKVTFLGRLIYYLLPYRRAIILSHMHQVYGSHLTALEKKQLAMAFYSHFATFLKELCILRWTSQKQLQNKVIVQGETQLFEAAAKGKGVLILTAHIGNWELAPIGGMLQFQSFKGRFHFIRRPLSIKWLEHLLFRRYFKAGLRIIPQVRGSLNQVCDVLAQNDAVIFVLDQHASVVNKDGIAVEFFGKKAGTYRSLATLARHTEAPVIPALTYRRADGTHVLAFQAPLTWVDYPSTQAALYHNTKRYNEALEEMILSHPAQWVWFHKRWKLS